MMPLKPLIKVDQDVQKTLESTLDLLQQSFQIGLNLTVKWKPKRSPSIWGKLEDNVIWVYTRGVEKSVFTLCHEFGHGLIHIPIMKSESAIAEVTQRYIKRMFLARYPEVPREAIDEIFRYHEAIIAELKYWKIEDPLDVFAYGMTTLMLGCEPKTCKMMLTEVKKRDEVRHNTQPNP